ncbi:hypothetical protein DA803_01285 [[Mycoplasma] phocae]|uniref:Nuclease n=1 Tax=[Mycoplasma] phocae TaxID=142651 RepID=A0A2Z5IPS5_9BACT|nr:hypothetical protein [[Mycoplasma] phocae]AXE60719.1 hypothetical protein DA803_01285 [[Mycoplasma] phocae]
MKKKNFKWWIVLPFTVTALPLVAAACNQNSSNEKKENDSRADDGKKTITTPGNSIKDNDPTKTPKKDLPIIDRDIEKNSENKENQKSPTTDEDNENLGSKKEDSDDKNSDESDENNNSSEENNDEETIPNDDNNNDSSKDENNNSNNESIKREDQNSGSKPLIEKPKFNSQIEEMFYKPENLIRVGHWNILNYGGGELSDKNGPKVAAISELIYKSQQDVIGLTEINYNQGKDVKNIVDALNELSNSSSYDCIVQPVDDANKTSSKATKEQIAIIYNTNKIKKKNFKNYNKNYQSYGNDKTNSGVSFKRPLFAAFFETIKGNKPFVSIFGHLDSPGKASEEASQNEYKSQGAQEVKEALDIANAFKYYEQLSDNASIIFGGDTNIKTKNNRLFNTDEFTSKGIKNYYGSMSNFKVKGKPTEQYEFYETSLGRNKGYSEAYDKLLFKEHNLNIIDENEKIKYNDERYQKVSFKADIINGFKNGIWDKKHILNLNPKFAKDFNGNEFSFIRSKISDHTMVYIDFED